MYLLWKLPYFAFKSDQIQAISNHLLQHKRPNSSHLQPSSSAKTTEFKSFPTISFDISDQIFVTKCRLKMSTHSRPPIYDRNIVQLVGNSYDMAFHRVMWGHILKNQNAINNRKCWSVKGRFCFYFQPMGQNQPGFKRPTLSVVPRSVLPSFPTDKDHLRPIFSVVYDPFFLQ